MACRATGRLTRSCTPTSPPPSITTTPTKALTLLNNKLTVQWAQALAGRVLREAGADQGDWPAVACRLAYCRSTNPDEVDAMRKFLDHQSSIVAEHAALPSYMPE